VSNGVISAVSDPLNMKSLPVGLGACSLRASEKT